MLELVLYAVVSEAASLSVYHDQEDAGAPTQSFWSCMWSSVQNAWIYIQSCAHDAAMAVASWLSPSYWMGSGEGGQEANNAAEAWV